MGDLTSDAELMKAFSAQGSELAFAELVRRHVDLVYSVARRQVHSDSLANEVAQSAFAALARELRRGSFPKSLPAWLHVVARRRGIDVARSESSRRSTELASAALAESADDRQWNEIEPLLDDAIAALPDLDRAAVVMRFYQAKTMREIGSALGSSENAAQKRLSRAVEQLRAFFVRRGVVVSAATLAACIAPRAGRAAPAHLQPLISAGLSRGAVEVVTASAPVVPFLVAAAAVVALGVFGFAEYRARVQADRRASQLAADLGNLRKRDAARAAELVELQMAKTPTASVAPGSSVVPAESIPPVPGISALVTVFGPDGSTSDALATFLQLTTAERSALDVAVQDARDEIQREFAASATLTSIDSFEIRVTVPPIEDSAGLQASFSARIREILGPERAGQFFVVGNNEINTRLNLFGACETTFVLSRAAPVGPYVAANPYRLGIIYDAHPDPRGGMTAKLSSSTQFASLADARFAQYKWLESYDPILPQLAPR